MKNTTHIYITLLLCFFSLNVFAQRAGNENCRDARPAIITGPRDVCEGETYVYCTNADPSFKSFEWTAPHTWTIISGQGTNCVTVRAGSNPGVMKVKVEHATCGTKVRTKHVHPRNCGTTTNPNPDEAVCVKQDACFRFEYLGKEDLADNKTKVRFRIAVDCNNDLSNAAFELPGNQAALAPTKNYSNTYKYTIENGTNNPFYAIKFEANNADGYKNGNSDIFEYVVNTDMFYEQGSIIRVSAKAGTTTGQVTFNTEECVETPPVCPTPIATIVGPDSVCAFGDEPVTYTANVENGTGDVMFAWSFPFDWMVVSQDTTANTIQVLIGFESGPVTVVATSECGATATATLDVLTLEDCSGLTPLPVELISFAGEATKSGVLLEWATASEQDNDRFEVERSADGKTFSKVGEVKGSGTTTARKTYSMRDTKAGRGTHYYRLRQVDIDGSFDYSKVIAVNNNLAPATAGLVVAPNPVTDGQFTIAMDAAEAAQLQIMDMNGRLLHSQQVSQGTREVILNAQSMNMRSGLYIISVKSPSATNHTKVVVR